MNTYQYEIKKIYTSNNNFFVSYEKIFLKRSEWRKNGRI